MPSTIQHLRKLDELVHQKVFRKHISKAPNYRTGKRYFQVVRKLREDLVGIDIDWPEQSEKRLCWVTLKRGERTERTGAPGDFRALLIAAVRWYGVGLFPHDLGKELGRR